MKKLQALNDDAQKKSARITQYNDELQWRLQKNFERKSLAVDERSLKDNAGDIRISSFVQSSHSASWTLLLEQDTTASKKEMLQRTGCFPSESILLRQQAGENSKAAQLKPATQKIARSMNGSDGVVAVNNLKESNSGVVMATKTDEAFESMDFLSEVGSIGLSVSAVFREAEAEKLQDKRGLVSYEATSIVRLLSQFSSCYAD